MPGLPVRLAQAVMVLPPDLLNTGGTKFEKGVHQVNFGTC